MKYRELTDTDKNGYNKLVLHPLQSWEWGDFRKSTGINVVRIGFFENNTLSEVLQLTFHPIPHTNFTVGYLPKGPIPKQEHLSALKEIGGKYQAVFIQIEPNIEKSSNFKFQLSELRPSTRPLFTKHTFFIDLSLSESKLLENFHPKTRYNIRLAQKHGVTIAEENTEEAFTAYIALTHETTKRQGFYAHKPIYHQRMWEFLRPAGIVHLFTARYKGKILAAWILFLFNGVLYYPYGASSSAHKEVMASNLMMWETIRWGKKHGATSFDLWGTPGADPKLTDAYYGFHKFKMGYGPRLVEFLGSYDLILKQPHYAIFTLLDKLRWFFLKLKTKL